VIQVLRYLEGRINAMINIWGLDGAMAAEAAEAERAKGDAALLHGPALPGHGLDQTDVDVVMGPVESGAAPPPVAAPIARAQPPAATRAPESDVKAELEDAEFVSEVAAEAGRQLAAEPEPVAPPLQPVAEAPRPVAQGDPLAAVTALSYEEKVALFT
jgi:chemotaxis protein CheZ